MNGHEKPTVGDERNTYHIIDELARNLAAAVIAHQMGNVSLDYTRKRYCAGPISESWRRMAEQIFKDLYR